MMTSVQRLELEEQRIVFELNLKRSELRRAQIAEELARLEVNETATRTALAEVRAKLEEED